MTDRYFLARNLTNEQRENILQRVRRNPGLAIVLDQPGVILIVDRDAAVISLHGAGVLIGSIYKAGQQGLLTELPSDEATVIARSAGSHLCHAYWGNYVALLVYPASDQVDLIRSPLGNLPCLFVASGGAWIAGSDPLILEELGGYRPSVDWGALQRFAVAPDVRFSETCLVGLNEVRGGDRLTMSRTGTTCDTIWSPWTFAKRERQIVDATEASRRLRDVIGATMGSIVSADAKSVILLSGGLDSSIVCASAASHGLDAQCVTISASAASGDERSFARQTTDSVGLALAERCFELAGVDLEGSGAAHAPRPAARAFEYEARRQAHLVAQDFGADALLSGGGGDNIFCSLQSVTPAVDCLRNFDDHRQFWRIARELSLLTNTSLLTVARRAWARSWQHGRQHPKPVNLQFLHPSIAVRTAEAPRHAWLQRPPSILPGKGGHVAALLGVQALTEDTSPLDPLALRYPLLAQPVVELCIQIPTWLWYDRGCNRAAARHAFSKELPHPIAWRRSKGTPDSFVVEIFDARRSQIRAMLCHGNLADRGLLDLPALVAVLDDPRPVRGTDHGRIMRLIDIEAWTRCWPATVLALPAEPL
jgi:asparagine synthase (glutamine-hydrolysing)